MKRVTGIGGIFFYANDPVALRGWYKRHLGIDVQDWGGAVFGCSDDAGGRRAARRPGPSAPPAATMSRPAWRPSCSTTASPTWMPC